MKRLFTAIKIHPDPAFLNKYKSLRTALAGDRINWVPEHNFHLTLKFFGETEERLIQPIGAMLQERAGMTGCFALHLSHIGIFGSSGAPRVIWTGIEPFQALQELMISVQRDVEPLGFERDRQNTVPHLTLGRIKFINDKRYFQKVIEQHKDIQSMTEEITSILLYESILRSEGPLYKVLQEFHLRK